MRRTRYFVFAVAVAFVTLAAFAAEESVPREDPEAETQEEPAAIAQAELDTASYGFGMEIGKQLKTSGMKLALDPFLKGFKDALENKKPAYTQEEMRKAMRTVQATAMQVQQRQMAVVGEENLAKAQTFLEENKSKPGVKTLPGGTQYEVMTEGTGTTATADDTVTAHYKGMLLNGETFDSSYERGEPATFEVGQVIKGWQEALAQMKTGDKWRLWVPPDQAYGEQGRPPVIPPNSLLIFEVELIKVGE